MKQIKDIIHAVNDEQFYREQFEEFAPEKNILFISPQLSGKQLYKTFLPFCGMYNTDSFTALSSIDKYNPREQLTDVNLVIKSSQQILWADFVVIPFTTLSLTDESNDLYDSIRAINSSCKIVFSIDFNFYELSDLHPYKDIFTEEAIQRVENNIWYSDICLVSNVAFSKYLLDKMILLKDGRMSGVHTEASIACMPFYVDTQILLANVDYDTQEPQSIKDAVKHAPSTKKQLEKISNTSKTKTDEKTQKVVNQIRVLFEDEKWVLKKGNYKKPIETYAKKSLAIDETKKWIEKGYDVIIYKQDGSVQKHLISKDKK